MSSWWVPTDSPRASSQHSTWPRSWPAPPRASCPDESAMGAESTTAGSPPVAAYPRDREVEIVLRDGSTVHVRPVRSDDRPAVRAFLAGLSEESIGFRFFGMPSLEWVADWAVDVDYADRFWL